MKIGVLGCCYDCADLFERVIEPWKKAQEKLSIEISVVHGLFKEYSELGQTADDAETVRKLADTSNDLDCVTFVNHNMFQNLKLEQEFLPEHEVRNKALPWLFEKKCDLIWLLDFDEIYTAEEIIRTINFINQNSLTAWFKIEFKNLTFSEKTYTKGFVPPRIFRRRYNGFDLDKMNWDNDFLYVENGVKFPYQNLPFQIIPATLCNPLHHTWLNNERSRKKVKYQELHFKNGAGCSYAWDEEKGLIWNEEYFKRLGVPKPKLFEL